MKLAIWDYLTVTYMDAKFRKFWVWRSTWTHITCWLIIPARTLGTPLRQQCTTLALCLYVTQQLLQQPLVEISLLVAMGVKYTSATWDKCKLCTHEWLHVRTVGLIELALCCTGMQQEPPSEHFQTYQHTLHNANSLDVACQNFDVACRHFRCHTLGWALIDFFFLLKRLLPHVLVCVF